MWTPRLDGSAAERARVIVREIAGVLRARSISPEDVGGAALFWAYAAGIWDDADTTAGYEAAIDRLVERVGGEYASNRLYGGLAGDGWVIAHVASDGAGELLAMIDDALLQAVSVARWERLYDLSSGLVGIAVYFLERLRTEPAAEAPRVALGHVVRHLAAACARDPFGCWWSTPPELLSEGERTVAPGGRIDLGVASGNAGVIAVLARVAVHDAAARPLLARAARWLWSRQLPPRPLSRFSSSLIAEVEVDPACTAWCEGDLGIAIALWSAAGDESTAAPRELMREIAMRSPVHCKIVDGSLCHGALGFAHVLDRCFAASRDPMCARAASGWYERAFALPVPDSTAFLDGMVGVGLGWMAGFDAIEPGWDRLIVCEVG